MQMCGLPVVVRDCQGLGESVSDGVNDCVVPAGEIDALPNAIRRLPDVRALCVNMSTETVQKIRSSFVPSPQVAGLRNVITVLLEGRRSIPTRLKVGFHREAVTALDVLWG